jgi:hypothetical protein
MRHAHLNPDSVVKLPPLYAKLRLLIKKEIARAFRKIGAGVRSYIGAGALSRRISLLRRLIV